MCGPGIEFRLPQVPLPPQSFLPVQVLTLLYTLDGSLIFERLDVSLELELCLWLQSFRARSLTFTL